MISVEHLTKYYGDHLALDDVSFEIDEGHVYGFLGPNGAGKSTTMNIMTGCLSASAGRVCIDGHDIFEEPAQAKRLIGYLPEHPPLYLHESPEEYLRFVGQARGLRGAEKRAQIDEALERTGLFDVRNRRIGALSKGYRQRVGIAQALLGSPRVIILDEPTVGLDPIQILEIRDLITELGRTHTVIFSSHILSEVQAICDRLVMIANGRLVAFGEPEEIRRQLLSPGEIVLTTDALEDELPAIVSGVAHIASVEPVSADLMRQTVRIRTDDEDIYALSGALFRAFAASGKTLYELSVKKSDLEDIFLELSASGAAEQEKMPKIPVAEDKESEVETDDCDLLS